MSLFVSDLFEKVRAILKRLADGYWEYLIYLVYFVFPSLYTNSAMCYGPLDGGKDPVISIS